MAFRRIVLAVLVLGVMPVTFPSWGAQKPNVIIIFTDDQGAVDMNAYGSEDLVTPNMDRLAMQGVRFTQFYAAGPVCAPSRIGLLTGRIPQFGGLEGRGSLGSQVMISEK